MADEVLEQLRAIPPTEKAQAVVAEQKKMFV
jgi:hypothetical protein